MILEQAEQETGCRRSGRRTKKRQTPLMQALSTRLKTPSRSEPAAMAGIVDDTSASTRPPSFRSIEAGRVSIDPSKSAILQHTGWNEFPVLRHGSKTRSQPNTSFGRRRFRKAAASHKDGCAEERARACELSGVLQFAIGIMCAMAGAPVLRSKRESPPNGDALRVASNRVVMY